MQTSPIHHSRLIYSLSLFLIHMIQLLPDLSTSDIEWVLQGRELGFSGFFTELLGISSQLVKKFPQMRLTKSIFWSNESITEPSVAHDDNLFNMLFPKEAKNMQKLLSIETTMNHTAESLVFDEQSIYLSNDMCDEVNIRDYSSKTLENEYIYNHLSKSKVLGITSKEECCRKCLQMPLCLSWTFSPDKSERTQNFECRLNSRKMKAMSSPVASKDKQLGERTSFSSIIEKRTIVPLLGL